MDMMAEINSRSDIQNIREFILTGCVLTNIQLKSYMSRIKESHKAMLDTLTQKYPDPDEYEKITEVMYDYVSVTQRCIWKSECKSVLNLSINYFNVTVAVR